MALIEFGESGTTKPPLVTYQPPAPAPAPATVLPTWLQNIIAPPQPPAQLTNRLLPTPPRVVTYEPMTQMQPPTLPTYQQQPTPQRSYQGAQAQPEAAKYPGGWYGFTPQNQANYAMTRPTPQQGTPFFQAIAQALTQPALAGSSMTPEEMEMHLLVPQGYAEQQRQLAGNTGNVGRTTPAKFGAELPGGEGWSPERIANATQTELRQFYSLDPRERFPGCIAPSPGTTHGFTVDQNCPRRPRQRQRQPTTPRPAQGITAIHLTGCNTQAGAGIHPRQPNRQNGT